MSPGRTVVLCGVGGAVAGAAFGGALRALGLGVGQAWGAPLWVELVGLGLAGAGLIGWLGARWARHTEREQCSMHHLSRSLGLTHIPGAIQPGEVPHLAALPVIAESKSLSNRMAGTYDGAPVELLDVSVSVSVTDSEGDSRTAIVHRTIVAFPGLEGLPDCHLAPLFAAEGLPEWLHGLMDGLHRLVLPVFGGGVVRFAPRGPGEPLVRQVIGQFHRHYQLRATGSAWAGQEGKHLRPEAAGALAATFSFEALRFFAIEPGWTVQVAKGCLAAWRDDRALSADERSELLHRALRLRDELTRRTSETRDRLKRTAFPPESVRVQVRRFLTLLGGAIGGFLAGILSGELLTRGLLIELSPLGSFICTGALAVAGLAVSAGIACRCLRPRAEEW